MASSTVGEMRIEFKADTDSAEKSVRKFSDVARESIIANIVNKGFNLAIDAAKDFASSLVEVGMNFEKSMSNVAAISGATGDDLDALTAKAKEMGENTVWSASDAADAMSYMAMAGWKTQDMLDGIGGMMDLATAAGADLATTSDIVTDALTAFGLSAADSGRLADVMAAASSNANTNVELMGETFKYAAPLAGTLGYSIEDTATAIGLMANAGIKGSQAGTAMRSMLTRLVNPPKAAARAMDELGLSVVNDNGTMKSLSSVMDDLRQTFRELTPEQQASYAADLAGQEAMSGLLAIVNASDADFNKLTNAVKDSNGAAAEMAAIMGDNLTGDVASLNSKFEALQIELYDKVKPALSGIVDGLKWVVENADWLIPVVSALIAAFVTYETVTKAAAIAQGLLNAVMNLSPIGLIVAAVTGLIAALVLLWNNCEGFRNFIMGAIQVIGTAVGAVGEFIGGVFRTIGEVATTVFQAIGNFIGSTVNFFVELFQNWWGIVTSIFEAIFNTAQMIFTNILNFIRPVIDLLVKAFQNWWNVVSTIFQAIWNIAKTVFEVIWSIVSTIIGNIITIFQNLWKIVSGIFQTLWNMVSSVFGAIGNFIGQVVGNIVDVFKNWWNFLAGIFQSVWNMVSDVFSKVWNFISDVVNNIKNAFQQAWNFITDIFGKVGSWFRDRFTEAFNAIKSIFSNIGNFFKGIWDKIVNVFREVGTRVGDAVSGAFKGVVNAVLGGLESILNFPIRAINKLIDVINALPGVELGHLDEFHLPRMAQGGIVPGTSYSGDHNMIMANSGEMVITRSQQAALWDMIESGNYGYNDDGGGGDNYTDNSRKVEFKQDITIKDTFTMEQFNQSMLAAMRGV